MTYWRLFYHIVWATKNREQSISTELAPGLHGCIAGKARSLGAAVHCVGGVEDHVHVVVSVPPTIALATFVRQLKGFSSYYANRELALNSRLAWQAQYGITSFDGRLLDRVIRYVREQSQHHAAGSTIPIFEKMSDDAATGEPQPAMP